MPTARPLNTRLAFGLVTCDVALYRTSSEAEKPSWQYAGPNGGELTQPRREQMSEAPIDPSKSNPLSLVEEPSTEYKPPEQTWVEEGTLQMVAHKERRRGIRREDGTFLDLTEGLEAIAEHTKLEEMRVADFIRTEEVRRERVLGSYYLAPNGPGAAKAVRLLHEAMRNTKRAAVVKLTKRSKQSLGVLLPYHHAGTHSLLLLEVAWAADVRGLPEKMLLPSQVEVSPGEIEMAVELVQAMSSTRADSLDAQEDDARRLRAELIVAAAAGKEFKLSERAVAEEGADVVDLMQRGLEDRAALAAAAA